MKIGNFDTDQDVLVIAEIGNNHEGSFDLAQELVGRAAETGAGAVKFQTFRTEHFINRKDAERFAKLESFALTAAQFEALADQAHEAGILFISTPFDMESAELICTIADAVKIASSDNTFYPLIEKAAESGKPLIFSTGLADAGQVRYADSLVARIWRENGFDQDRAVLHCVTSYPVPPEAANLAAIGSLHRLLPDAIIGYSDHTIGIEASVLAVAMGARIIEKHFTVNKNHSDFRDHQLSADPADLKQLMNRITETTAMIGDGAISLSACEADIDQAVRRSIVVSRNLPAGHVLGPLDITWTRPGGGLAPGREAKVLGRRLVRPIAAHAILSLDDLD